MKQNPFVAYVPGETRLITIFNSEGKSIYGGEDFSALQQEYPTAIRLKLNEVLEQIATALQVKYLNPDPVAISLEAFLEARDELFPLHWEFLGNSQLFQSPELIEGNYTSTYVRLCDRNDACFSMTHLVADLKGALQRVNTFLQSQEKNHE